MVLRDMGKAGLAIMVLGTAACASQTSDGGTFEDDTAASVPDPSLPSSSTSMSSGHIWHRAHLGFVSAYILHRDGESVIIDTGVAESEGSIGRALGEAGLGWDSVGQVVITHRHGDHQGSLPAVLELTSGDVPWYVGAGDADAIVGTGAARIVGDGDRVFDLDIIETPGHTPGHISILDSVGGVLISGDALNGVDGGVVGANPQFTDDMALANASVIKLAGFDYETLLFGHGEPILANASRSVSELAAGL
jgi:glyoxylase-like metal-dependent hydrolase (beta-lactamase superfamily II)